MTSLTKRIASYMGDELNLDNDNQEVVAYSLELLFHTAITILLVLLVALLIGPLKEAIVLIIVMFLFKNFAGGAHCNSAVRCIILSVLLIPSFAYLSFIASQYLNLNIVIIITSLCILFSCVLVYKLAPVTSQSMSVVTDRYRQNRRYLSFLLLIIVTIVQISLISITPISSSLIIAIDISIFWQAFMLTKKGHDLVSCYDKLLLGFVGKGGDINETH